MNPSAREVLEADMKKCEGCKLLSWLELIHPNGPTVCVRHQGVLHGIELAERADLERVEATLELMEAEEERLNANYGGRYDCPHPEPCNTFYRAITIVRAAFPEVKEKP